MGAGAYACVSAVAPIKKVVAAFVSGRCVIGDFIGGQDRLAAVISCVRA